MRIWYAPAHTYATSTRRNASRLADVRPGWPSRAIWSGEPGQDAGRMRVQADLDVLVQALLNRQFDAKADGYAIRADGTPVRGLHDPWSATSDHRVARCGQPRSYPFCPLILERAAGSPG